MARPFYALRATNGTPSNSKCEEWSFVASCEEGLKLVNMYFVYIIQSIKYPSELYKGFTRNLDDRMRRHNSGKERYTAKYKPWKLVFYCAFENKKTALAFEKYLKTASGIAFMRKRLIKIN